MWGSAGFVRIYGHMIHRRPTDTAVAIGCLYRDRREGYRHGGRQAVRKCQQCPPRTVDRAEHPRPRHALPDCPTLFGTLLPGQRSTPPRKGVGQPVDLFARLDKPFEAFPVGVVRNIFPVLAGGRDQRFNLLLGQIGECRKAMLVQLVMQSLRAATLTGQQADDHLVAAAELASSASIFDHGIEMMQLDPFRQFGPFFFTQTDHIELLHNHPSQLWPQLTGRQLIMPVYDVE